MTEKLGVFQAHTRPFGYYVAWVLEDGDAGGSFGGTANPDTTYRTHMVEVDIPLPPEAPLQATLVGDSQ